MIRYATIAGVIFFGIAPAFLLASPTDGLDCYLVQMHIHAHTNHNGNRLPASLEWHCAQAENHGFDVIWWSEHSEIFDTFEDIKISFDNAMLREGSDFIDLGITRARRRLSRLNLETPAEGWTAEVTGDRLETSVTCGSCCFGKMRLTPASERGTVRTVGYCRPVASGLRLEVAMDVRGLGEDSYVTIGFDLAAHPDGRHHLVFDIVRDEPGEPEVVGDTLVTLEVGVDEFPATVSLDLEAAAALLPDGLDNTLNTVFLEFGARRGTTLEVALDSLVLKSDRGGGENQHRVLLELMERYEERHGITQYMGVEASGIHTPERPHMNAFFPDSTETFENMVIDPEIERIAWALGVGRQGGLVSLNHPFGAALRPSARGIEAYSDTMALMELADSAGPIPGEDLWEVARPIIETGGLGCTMLEVGYIFRGSGSLDDHLRLWDLVLAHGVRMVGNGVSDAHGGVWGSDLRPNPFATWIWAEGKDRASLLQALEAGRVCFGDPFAFGSRFAFGVEGAFMGDTLRVGPGEEVRGWVEIEPWVDGLDVVLVEVKIEPGPEPVYISRASLADARGGFDIRVEDPCFARIEVYGEDGRPLAFSNPVWLIPE